MSSVKAAARYIEQGWAVVPVPSGAKSPGRDGWQDLRIGLEDVPRYFTNGQNIGIHCGEPSGWLVPVDLDAPEALRIADRFLPPTRASGRESTPDSHRWYFSEGVGHKTFKDLDGSMILELRSTGHHTLVEPSKHPGGESYRWDRTGRAIATTPAGKLLHSCQELATAALIARHLPDTRDEGGGGRHELALALAGFLIRRGLSEELVSTILVGGWDAKGYGRSERGRREAHRDLEGVVSDTAARLRDDRPATGGKRLEELLPGVRARIAKFWDWGGRLDDETAEAFNNTDLGNARRFVAWEGGALRYCHPWRRWLAYDGQRWKVDDRGEVVKRAKTIPAKIYREASEAADEQTRKALGKHAAATEHARSIGAMIKLSEPEVPVVPDELDPDPWKLGVLNGTIDLRTGKLGTHSRGDLITKMAPVEYDPHATAPNWREVLERVLPSDEVRAFFKRLCGYALAGVVSEHILPILYGTGANGKSTVMNALLEVWGDYGIQAAPDLLIAKRGAHPTELADLFGMRLVASVETEDGRRFAESLVKQLTGGDKVRARRMREDFWQFTPTHTVFLATNHRPEVRGTDLGIWRRIHLIPFTETIPPDEQDTALPEKLRGELSGILAWCVEGCLEWQLDGLQAPDEVLAATKEYREEMDVLGAFLEECCEVGPEKNVAASELYQAYGLWCTDNGEQQETQRKFGRRLTERGVFSRYKGGSTGGHRWRGLDLLTLWKSRISRDSDPTDVKVSFNSQTRASQGTNSKSGSEGSEGSADPSDVAKAAREIGKAESGPAKMLAAYLEKPNRERLMYLTRAVLVARGEDPARWEALAGAVEAAAASPDNHPIGCECGGCE